MFLEQSRPPCPSTFGWLSSPDLNISSPSYFTSEIAFLDLAQGFQDDKSTHQRSGVGSANPNFGCKIDVDNNPFLVEKERES